MVAPLIIGGAIAIGSAIAQYLNSEEGRRLSRAERQKLEKLLRDTESPRFDTSMIDPETYRVVAKYKPEVADFIAEQAPELTRMDSADAIAAREAQREALSRMRALQTGNDPLGDAELADALAKASIANRGRTSAIREDFARRGQGGGVAEMLAQLVGSQQANEQAAEGARGAYIEAQRRRLQAMRDAAGLAGQIRDDEYQLERGNNDLINGYNQRFAARRQDWANAGAEARNAGQRFNITNEQDVANKNTGVGNTFKVNERNRVDELKQRGFDNEMGKVRTFAGVTDMARADAIGTARDRNSAISGAADGAQTALAYSQGGQQQQPQATQQQVWAGEDYSDPLNRKYRTGRANA